MVKSGAWLNRVQGYIRGKVKSGAYLCPVFIKVNGWCILMSSVYRGEWLNHVLG